MKPIYVIAVAGSLLTAYLLIQSAAKQIDTPTLAQSTQRENGDGRDSFHTPWKIGAIISPFSAFKQPAINKEQFVRQRVARMQTGKYETPIEYYRMNLEMLTKLAQEGDVNAMVQLGEQYASEVDLIQQDTKFDRKVDTQVTSQRYFTQAIQSGYTHIAAVMAFKALESSNPVEAQAWDLVAQYFHDPDRGALYDPLKTFAALSDDQQKAVAARFQEIATTLRMEGNLPTDWTGYPGYGAPQ